MVQGGGRGSPIFLRLSMSESTCRWLAGDVLSSSVRLTGVRLPLVGQTKRFESLPAINQPLFPPYTPGQSEASPSGPSGETACNEHPWNRTYVFGFLRYCLAASHKSGSQVASPRPEDPCRILAFVSDEGSTGFSLFQYLAVREKLRVIFFRDPLHKISGVFCTAARVPSQILKRN
jgi:hypothetical protein